MGLIDRPTQRSDDAYDDMDLSAVELAEWAVEVSLRLEDLSDREASAEERALVMRLANEVALTKGAPATALGTDPVAFVKARSLTDAIRARGRDIGSVAASVGLPRTLLIRLGRGLIAFESIPSRVFEYLAVELRTSREQVSAWIDGGPVFEPQASYLALQAPANPTQSTFHDALASEPSVTDEMLRQWLGEDDAARVE